MRTQRQARARPRPRSPAAQAWPALMHWNRPDPAPPNSRTACLRDSLLLTSSDFGGNSFANIFFWHKFFFNTIFFWYKFLFSPKQISTHNFVDPQFSWLKNFWPNFLLTNIFQPKFCLEPKQNLIKIQVIYFNSAFSLSFSWHLSTYSINLLFQLKVCQQTECSGDNLAV